jgi:hypothetical protein
VLGRIGTGAAVAALPLATALTAAAQGWSLAAWLASALVVGVALYTLAPWIPGVRMLLPSQRRLATLDALWAEGHRLAFDDAVGDDDGPWRADCESWQTRTHEWLGTHMSSSDAESFRRPTSAGYKQHFGATQNRTLLRQIMLLQLDELARFRDQQKPR